MGYSKAPEQPQSSAGPICHSQAMTRTGREPATIYALLHIGARCATHCATGDDHLKTCCFFLFFPLVFSHFIMPHTYCPGLGLGTVFFLLLFLKQFVLYRIFKEVYYADFIISLGVVIENIIDVTYYVVNPSLFYALNSESMCILSELSNMSKCFIKSIKFCIGNGLNKFGIRELR